VIDLYKSIDNKTFFLN